jgi:hypothetical protein
MRRRELRHNSRHLAKNVTTASGSGLLTETPPNRGRLALVGHPHVARRARLDEQHLARHASGWSNDSTFFTLVKR